VTYFGYFLAIFRPNKEPDYSYTQNAHLMGSHYVYKTIHNFIVVKRCKIMTQLNIPNQTTCLFCKRNGIPLGAHFIYNWSLVPYWVWRWL